MNEQILKQKMRQFFPDRKEYDETNEFLIIKNPEELALEFKNLGITIDDIENAYENYRDILEKVEFEIHQNNNRGQLGMLTLLMDLANKNYRDSRLKDDTCNYYGKIIEKYGV